MDLRIISCSIFIIVIHYVVCRYAYSEETWDDLEEEGILLTGSTVILTGELATKRERKLSNADLFGLV